MRKFATKIVSRKNSKFTFLYFNYFNRDGVLFGAPGVMVDVPGVLFGVLGVLFGVPGVLVGVLGVWWFGWRKLYIFWRNWCLWHWDVVFVTFRIWNGASILITKKFLFSE